MPWNLTTGLTRYGVHWRWYDSLFWRDVGQRIAEDDRYKAMAKARKAEQVAA